MGTSHSQKHLRANVPRINITCILISQYDILRHNLMKKCSNCFCKTLYGHFCYIYLTKLSICHHFVNLSTFLNGCWHQTVWATEKLQTFLESWEQSDRTMFYSPRSFDHAMWPKNGPKVRHFGGLFAPLTSYNCGVQKNQISFVKRNLEKSLHGALRIDKTKGSMSGFFYTPLNEGDLVFLNTAYFWPQHQISLFWRTSCRFFSKSIQFVI